MNNLATIKSESQNALSYGILNPQTLDEALKMADIISRSNLVPKDFQGNPGNILIAMQWGMELGMAPLQAMQNIAVINGRPSIWGDAMIAIARSAPSCEYITETLQGEGDAMIATCKAKRKGQPEEIRTYSVEDAKTAGLWNKQGPWKTSPKRMLQLRARAFAIRDVFADALRGMASAEEQQDIADLKAEQAKREEKDITPPKQEPAAIPHYPADQFEANFPKWQSVIQSGKKDADFVISMASTKGVLTEDQEARIRAVGENNENNQ